MAVLKPKPVDLWLAMGSVAVALLLFMLPRTPGVVVVLIVVLALLMMHPLWNFWWIEESLARRAAAIAVLAVSLLLLCAWVWPEPAGSPHSLLYVALVGLRKRSSRINARWIDRATGALAMSAFFGLVFALRRARSWSAKRERNSVKQPAKGFLECKVQAEKAMKVLPDLAANVVEVMTDVGPAISKRTNELLRVIDSSEGALKVAAATARTLDRFSRRFESVGAAYARTGRSLVEGLNGWGVWLEKGNAPKSDVMPFIESLTTAAQALEVTNARIQEYITTSLGNKGAASVLDDAIDRHVRSVNVILEVNSEIRESYLGMLARFGEPSDN